MRRNLPAALMAVLILALPAGAEEAVLLSESAMGLLPLDGENRLTLSGFTGEISIRLGKAGELRFMGMQFDDHRTEMPAALWQDGRNLFLRPAAGSETVPIFLEVGLPRGMNLRVEIDDSRVVLRNIGGDLTVKGAGLDLEVFGIEGTLDAELLDGTARIDNVAADVNLELVDVEATAARIRGAVYGSIQRGSLELGAVSSDIRLDLERTGAVVQEAGGRAEISASDSTLALNGVRGGGELRLRETRLALKECDGDLKIETDADVVFEMLEADLHVNSYGGSLSGKGNKGLLEIKTESATVDIAEIEGPVRVEGDGLQIRLKQIGGELWVLATSSDVFIDGASSQTTVENDFGNVIVQNAAKQLQVQSRDGDVRLGALNGPVYVEADGDLVAVGWASLNHAEDSFIQNERGDVAIGFPSQGGCTFEAQSDYGRIESELPEIEISGSGDRASGIVNRRSRPTVRVESAGEVRIVRGNPFDTES